jgi:ABC-2 type transport system ATP-binding protein
MNFFTAEHIVKNYANHKALDDVSISVPAGAIYGLLGPNGAGKTSLIRVINQITAPDAGTLHIGGRPLVPADVNRVGYLPEERGLYKKMKTGEQALYFARLKGLSRHDAIKRLKTWFEKFEIESWWDKKVAELSKGMAQKVQFIITVLHEPELLIFDEPFSGFDPINVELLKREILALRDRGATIIFSTHNMASVEETCTHIALIHKARNIVEGPINQIRESHANNTFSLHYRRAPLLDLATIAAPEYTVITDDDEGDTRRAVLRQNTPCPANTLLQRVLPAADVLSYRQIIPTMHDIFIQLTTHP